MHELFALAFSLALGASLGFFGGLFGIGGGIIAIPVLVLGFGMEQAQAQGSALVLMVPNLLVGWWRYRQRHPVAWSATACIALSASITTWLLAGLANRLPPELLRQLFGGFLGLLALQLLHSRKRADNTQDAPLPLSRLPWVGALGGAVMGLLGIGGGLVAGPLLSTWLRQRQSTAQGLSLALVTPAACVALLNYAQAGRVDWGLGLPLAVGGLLTVSAGVRLAHRLPERKMRSAFAALLLTTAVWLLLGRRLFGI